VLTREDHSWALNPVARGVVTEPGIVVYRFSATLFYANAGFFAEEVRLLCEPASPRVRWVIVDCGAITHVDYSAARMLIALHQDLEREGVELELAHVDLNLRADLDRHGVSKAIGQEHIFAKLRHAITKLQEQNPNLE
jgi:MFS superfamily sulfate permease-like transporter